MRKSDQWLWGILLFCIFSFKVVLIGSGGSSGVRTDDFLMLIAYGILLLSGDLKEIFHSRICRIYLLFLGVNLLAALWNSAMGRVEPVISLVFVVRLFQYMVFYPIGWAVARSGRSLKRSLTIYLGMLCVVVPLQLTGVLPTMGSFAGIQSRAVGNTNGPYELAAVSGFLICYFGYLHRQRMKGWVAVVFLILSASRITFLGTALSGMRVVVRRSKSKLRLALLLAGLLGGVVASAVVYQNVVGESKMDVALLNRLTSASSSNFASNAVKLYGSIPVYDNSYQYQQGAFMDAMGAASSSEGQTGEQSGAIRLYRWVCLIKSTLANTDSTFLGLGPSFGSTAVDGYYVRVFAETGLIGLAVFFYFVLSVLREGESYAWSFREYALILFVTCCFIDIFSSYKPMLFFWLWYGMNSYYRQRLDDASSHAPGQWKDAECES